MMQSNHVIDIHRLGEPLVELAHDLARDGRRMELLDSAGESFILLTKRELDDLESALNLLSDTPTMRAVSESIGYAANKLVAADSPLARSAH